MALNGLRTNYSSSVKGGSTARVVQPCSSTEQGCYNIQKDYFSSPPTQADYYKTESLFRDFGINTRSVTIPEFATRTLLFNWRTNYIKKYLDDKYC